MKADYYLRHTTGFTKIIFEQLDNLITHMLSANDLCWLLLRPHMWISDNTHKNTCLIIGHLMGSLIIEQNKAVQFTILHTFIKKTHLRFCIAQGCFSTIQDQTIWWCRKIYDRSPSSFYWLEHNVVIWFKKKIQRNV